MGHLPPLVSCSSSGELQFEGGISEACDVLLWATGYRFQFPFLDSSVLSVEDNCVSPLYKHLFHEAHPSLVVLGLPLRVVPFPCFEYQMQLVAAVWCGQVGLPPLAARRAHNAQHAASLVKAGEPVHHTHMMGSKQ